MWHPRWFQDKWSCPSSANYSGAVIPPSILPDHALTDPEGPVVSEKNKSVVLNSFQSESAALTLNIQTANTGKVFFRANLWSVSGVLCISSLYLVTNQRPTNIHYNTHGLPHHDASNSQFRPFWLNLLLSPRSFWLFYRCIAPCCERQAVNTPCHSFTFVATED